MRLLFALLLILAPACARPADFPARVVGISDGDTLTVHEGRTQTKIRLHGIDAPETGQDHGSRAKQAASELAYGKTVTVRPIEKDRYGRTVAEITLPDGRSMNREMVGQGAAWWYREYARADFRLERLESEAKAAHRGLWAQPNPVPPWKWRKGEAVTRDGHVVGNRRSYVYHEPHCTGAARIGERNRVEFPNAGKAEAAGFRKARDCR